MDCTHLEYIIRRGIGNLGWNKKVTSIIMEPKDRCDRYHCRWRGNWKWSLMAPRKMENGGYWTVIELNQDSFIQIKKKIEDRDTWHCVYTLKFIFLLNSQVKVTVLYNIDPYNAKRSLRNKVKAITKHLSYILLTAFPFRFREIAMFCNSSCGDHTGCG